MAYWICGIYMGHYGFFKQISKSDFLSVSWTAYSYTHYPALQFINKELPDNSKILIAGDARSFYIKKKFIASSAFDVSPLAEYAKSSKNATEMYIKMRKNEITHILLNVAEAQRLEKGYGIFDWDSRSSELLKEFFEKYTLDIFVKKEKIENNGRVFINRISVLELTDKSK
ncbi:MAG: hypothetical protein KKD35_00205 [Elusimicrobia bacterium]|nr:hypothetical protein [Elusimicrobiota bacterium]